MLSTLVFGVAMATAPPRQASAAGVTVSWAVEDGILHGTVEAQSTGWVCVGFNDTPGLDGARLVMGWARGEDSGVEEHIAAPPDHAERTSLGRPPGLISATATESGGRTRIEFDLRLDTDDPRDPQLRPGEPVHLILAWSRDDDLQHHSASRGAVDTRL